MVRFMRASEVAREISVSTSYAYKLIQQLNAELKDKGYITIPGWINHQYFQERLYGGKQKEAQLDAYLQGRKERQLVCHGTL